MGIVADVDLLPESGNDCVKITVQPSNTPVTFHGKLYYRSGSTLQELNGVSAQNYLLKKLGVNWDSQIVEDASLEDIDAKAVEYFVAKGVENGRLPQKTKNDSTQKILTNLKVMNREGRLTMAALMLFGKDPQRFCLNARFKIGRFGTNGGELITQDMVDGNLLQMADKVMAILSDKYLVRPIHYEGMQRIEPIEIPERALRELLYNSIIHKSYDGPDIQMKIFNDHITLWNYGLLPEGITLGNILAEHSSMPRNRLIANAFYLAGFVEAWGRGFEIVAEAFKQEELETPVFKEEFGGFSVSIKREVFMAIQSGGRIDDKTGRIVKNNDTDVVSDVVSVSLDEITERQKNICNLISSNPSISSKQMSLVFSVDSRTIQRDLAALQKRGGLDSGR